MRKKNKIVISIISVSLILGLIPNRVNATPTSKATGYGLSNPRVEQNGTVTWDCVYFGNYYQNAYQPKQIPDNPVSGNKYVDSDGTEMIYEEFPGIEEDRLVTYHVYYKKEPIKWRVLSVDGDNAFLLADKNLDAQAYNSVNKDVVWANSTLRKWLNDEFYNVAFTNSEQGSIIETDWLNEDGKSVKDKVSTLSLTEACNAKYGFNSYSNAETETRKAKNTEYAKTNGAFTYEGAGGWWLRSYDDWLEKVYNVETTGDIHSPSTFYLYATNKAVRPCIHLNLSANTWTKADTVTATGGTFATPTPEPTPTPTPTPKPTATPMPTPITTPKPTNPIGVATNSPIKPTETATPKQPSTPTPTQKTITAPSKPTKLSAKNNKKKSVTLSWKKVTDATGYQIQYAANTAFAKKKLKSTKKTKLVIKNLKKKKTYSFRVRAYKVSNNVKVYGNWSKVKSIKIRK